MTLEKMLAMERREGYEEGFREGYEEVLLERAKAGDLPIDFVAYKLGKTVDEVQAMIAERFPDH